MPANVATGSRRPIAPENPARQHKLKGAFATREEQAGGSREHGAPEGNRVVKPGVRFEHFRADFVTSITLVA